jgi:hypothetical protein
MNIGKRQFLKFLVLASAGCSTPLSNVFKNNNYYVNREFGFGFIIPAGWIISSGDKFTELARKQIVLENHFSLEELMAENAETLAAVIHKNPNLAELKFSPSVTFHITSDQVLTGHISFAQYVDTVINDISKIYKNFELLEPAELTTGSDFFAYRYKSRFLFEYEGVPSLKVDDEVLIVNHSDKIFLLSLYHSPCTGEDCSKELQIFKESLHIA